MRRLHGFGDSSFKMSTLCCGPMRNHMTSAGTLGKETISLHQSQNNKKERMAWDPTAPHRASVFPGCPINPYFLADSPSPIKTLYPRYKALTLEKHSRLRETSTKEEAKTTPYIRKAILAAIFFSRLEEKRDLKTKVMRQGFLPGWS